MAGVSVVIVVVVMEGEKALLWRGDWTWVSVCVDGDMAVIQGQVLGGIDVVDVWSWAFICVVGI